MTAAWDTAGFRQAERRFQRMAGKTLRGLQAIGSDPQFMRELATVAAANSAAVFASGGSAASADWQGREYVDTGTLRRQMTTPGALLSMVSRKRIVFRPAVKYRNYVRPVFVWTRAHQQRIADAAERLMLRATRL